MSLRWLLLGVSVLFATGLPATAQNAANPASEGSSKSLAERVAAVGKRRQELEKKFWDERRAANNDSAKIAEADRRRADGRRDAAIQLKALIKERPRDPAAFDAIRALLETEDSPPDAEIISIVLDHHLADPKMGQLCFDLRFHSRADWVEQILEVVAEKHPQRDARGLAVFALGDYHRAQALIWGGNLSTEEREVLLAKAAPFYEQASKVYPDVRLPDSEATLAEAAGHELARLRNLPNLKVGKLAPQIVGKDLEGKPLQLEDHRGKVVVVSFWSTSCSPCMAMVPLERELYQSHREQPFVLLGVNCGDTLQEAQAKSREHRMSWPCWWDGEGQAAIQTEYDIRVWPTIFVIDARGIIRAIYHDEALLGETVETLLSEMNVKTDGSKSLAERVAAIGKQQDELRKTFHDELTAARHDSEKVDEANRKYNDSNRGIAEELRAIIKAHPRDPAALDAALVLVGKASYFLDDPATSIVLDYHLADPRMGQLCFDIRHRWGENWAERILKQTAEKHPQRDVRGQAVFALGDLHRSQAFPWSSGQTVERREELLAKARHYYEQAANDFPGARTPDGKFTLAEKAGHELARLRNLPNLVVGKPAPPIVGRGLDGNLLRLEDYRGKVVVVVFWGSWCGPCMAMVPHERELYEQHRDKPFALIGVNCGDTLETAQTTAQKHRISWPCWWEDEMRGPIQTEYNIQLWPTFFVIDARGIIRATGHSEQAHELDETVDTLLSELSGGAKPGTTAKP